MGFDLESLGQKRTVWLPLSGQLSGVELLLKYSSPREQEKFRQKLVRQGVLKSGRSGDWQIASGRQDDFFELFAGFYVEDWRGDITPQGTEYDHRKMGQILAEYTPAFEQVSNAVSDDAAFFVSSNGG